MKITRCIALALTCALMFSLCACFGAGGSKPSNGKTTIQFWGWGDDVEAAVFQNITNKFNETVGAEKGITVKYVQKASSSYSSDTALALSGNHTPDVVYVEDKFVKSWAEAEYLAILILPTPAALFGTTVLTVTALILRLQPLLQLHLCGHCRRTLVLPYCTTTLHI